MGLGVVVKLIPGTSHNLPMPGRAEAQAAQSWSHPKGAHFASG